MRLRRVLHRAGDLALTLGALVGVLCLVMTLAGVLFGVRPVVFLSGSMSPTIPAGSLAVSHEAPAAELRTGDVVAVSVGDTQVTHRIVAITHRPGAATLQLRGDANDRADEQTYEVTSAPRVLVSVPVVGRLIAWFSHAPGIFVLAAYAALLLALVLRRAAPVPASGPGDGQSRESATHRKRSPRRLSRNPFRAFATATVVVLGLWPAVPAWGAWGDAVPVSGIALGTYTVPVPATFTCGGVGVLSVTFNWTAVAGATGYTLHYGTNGTQTVAVPGTTRTVVTAISGGKAWVEANRNFGSTTWTSAASQTRTYTVAVVSVCS